MGLRKPSEFFSEESEQSSVMLEVSISFGRNGSCKITPVLSTECKALVSKKVFLDFIPKWIRGSNRISERLVFTKRNVL